jgi:hypothetical protein
MPQGSCRWPPSGKCARLIFDIERLHLQQCLKNRLAFNRV